MTLLGAKGMRPIVRFCFSVGVVNAGFRLLQGVLASTLLAVSKRPTPLQKAGDLAESGRRRAVILGALAPLKHPLSWGVLIRQVNPPSLAEQSETLTI